MTLSAREDLGTHTVTNQPAVRGDRDLWREDIVAQNLIAAAGGQTEPLRSYGDRLGRTRTRDTARAAEQHSPELRLFDAGGRRLDEVIYHPAYHDMMHLSAGAGYHSVAWDGAPGGHVTHAAMVYLASQVEPGHCCPLTMTYAAAPVIRAAAHVPDAWRNRLAAAAYDPSIQPVTSKKAITIGMAMTEKQGGSDVRANTTRALKDGNDWRLTGHKWFCSAPMSDGFLTLAQTDAGLSCFLVPRWLDAERNGIRLQRLKDKLGNRANASSEIEYADAFAYQVGDLGNGVRTIVEMVHHTRLDTAIAPAGLMRAALAEAHHWVTHRAAFQRRLIDQPLMRAVLGDATLDWAGTLALALHVAAAFDADGEDDRAFARIAVALAKYLGNKLCPQVVCEAMETLGGMGYVEDTPLPMLYREAPLNGIWEGSANVICLDVLRTLHREPRAAEMLEKELAAARGINRDYDANLAAHQDRWSSGATEAQARWFVEETATLLTASVLLRSDQTEIANAYAATRLTGDRGRMFGTIPKGLADKVLSTAFIAA